MKPKNRSECRDVPGACPYVSCRYNLMLDVSSVGSILTNCAPGRQSIRVQEADDHRIGQAAHDVVKWIEKGLPTCALDLIDELGYLTLREIGESYSVSRERIRQIEVKALRKVALALCEDPDLRPEWANQLPRWVRAKTRTDDETRPREGSVRAPEPQTGVRSRQLRVVGKPAQHVPRRHVAGVEPDGRHWPDRRTAQPVTGGERAGRPSKSNGVARLSAAASLGRTGMAEGD